MADLITTKMKLKDAFPDLAGEFDDGAEFVRKGLVPADLKVDEGERAIVSYITTAAVDRDMEIVLPSGGDLKHYRKNPVVLFGHNYRSLPIGKNLWIKADDKGLIAKTQYASHDEAEKVYQYRKDGFPLAESIGFVPIKYFYKKYDNGTYKWTEGDLRILEQDYGLSEKEVKNARCVYVKWTMLEYSDVAVPANPEAIELAKSKGLIPGDNPPEPVEIVGEPTLETIAAALKVLTDSVLEVTKALKDSTSIKEELSFMAKSLESLKADTASDNLEDSEEDQEIITLGFIQDDTEEEEIFDYSEVAETIKSTLEKNKKDTLKNVSELITDEVKKMKGIVITT